MSEPIATRHTPDLSRVTTGAAAANLRGGQFQFAATPPQGSVAQISATQAQEIALAWRSTFGTSQRDYLSLQHGSPVEPEQLTVCGRTFYAESAFDPPLAGAASDPLQLATARTFGPWWLVQLCAATGAPVVTLAVSAFDTDVTVNHGELILPMRGGNWFLAQAVPQGTTDWPVGPEEAVARVAQLAGEQVTEVPVLVAPPYSRGRPQDARWRIVLNNAANGAAFRPAGAGVTTAYAWRPFGVSAIHVGVAAAKQPSELIGYYLAHPITPGHQLSHADFAPLTFQRRPDMAIDVNEVPPTDSVSGGSP